MNGQFSRVVAYRARPIVPGLTHLEPRSCVIKFLNIESRFAICASGDEDTVRIRLSRLQRRIVMEAYVLNRLFCFQDKFSHVSSVMQTAENVGIKI